MYGKNGAQGLGGTFGAVFDQGSWGGDLSAMTMAGFRNQASVKNTNEPVKSVTWTGYAAGWVKSGGSVQLAYSSNPNEVQITLNPAEDSVTTNVNMRIDGTGASVGFANAASKVEGKNIHIAKNAFVAVKDIHGTPSYVAAAGSDDGLDYQTWGVWSVESAHTGASGATVLDGSHWIAGTMTSLADMQIRTGTATYKGHVHGTAYEGGALHALEGTSTLIANFENNTIGGKFNVNYVNGSAYAVAEIGTNVQAVEIRNDNQFGGPLGGAGVTGSIHGAFYGLGAAEVGGNWSINKDNGASHATGIFGGKEEKR